MRTWKFGQWCTAAVSAVAAAVAIGVPTGVVPTSLYTRMTPVIWWNYPVWALTSVLMGLLVATYVGGDRAAAPPRPRSARAMIAGILSAFAVGCPVCNKLVILAFGVSGALSYWAPAQPLMALASLALLGHTLARRLRAANACPVPADPKFEPAADYDGQLVQPDGTGAGGERSGRASVG